jgi:hypothetical protein
MEANLNLMTLPHGVASSHTQGRPDPEAPQELDSGDKAAARIEALRAAGACRI